MARCPRVPGDPRAALVARGLRPELKQGVQALLLWPSGRGGRPRVDGYRFARMYDTWLARPRLAVTERRAAALAAALAARMTCPRCGVNRGYVPSARLGACNQCAAEPGFAA